jgi:FKBP-type peptidyl-prolyl cis-trans isomerase FklB
MLKKFGTILGIIVILSALCLAEVKTISGTSSATPTVQTVHATPTPKVQSTPKPPFKTEREKLSYSIGLDIGKNLKKQEIDIDLKVLMKGLTDAYSGGKELLTEEQVREVFATFQKDMQAKQQERQLKLAEKNKAEGEAFLAANKAKEGVVTLPSGLQYKEITPGTGPNPTSTDTVIVHYQGTLVDGTEFDSSYKRGQPLKIPVSGVIPGWSEGIQLMKVGAKWQLFIPANLAYGPQGAGQVIGPNAMLIFEVELLGIEPKTDAPPQ